MHALVSADDLVAALIAAVLIAFAGAAFGLAHLRRAKRDTALLAFGVFSALYGVRLLADTDAAAVFQIPDALRGHITASITYAILVPAGVFIEQIVGYPGWRSSIRRLWQFQSVLAVVATVVDVVRGAPGAMMWVNAPMVVLCTAIATPHLIVKRDALRGPEFRFALAGGVIFIVLALHESVVPPSSRITGDLDLEPLGMLAMVAGLGHFATYRALSNERRLAAISTELETAREIQASIVPQSMPAVDGVTIAARYVPASSVAGDFYDFLPTRHGVGVLVADVTGHGMAAALIASMLKTALIAQEEHADDPAHVLTGLNRLLAGRFARSFVTAAYAVITPASRRVVYGSAGHPPLICRRHTGAIEELAERGLLLGCFPDVAYTNSTVVLAPGDRIVLYTDGVTEAMNGSGEYFGDAAFRRTIEHGHALTTTAFADRVIADLARWTAGAPAADDVTLVVVDISDP